MKNTWPQVLVVSQSDSTALANSTTETTILPAEAKLTFPADFWESIGQRLLVRAHGRISNIVTTPGTITFKLKFGTNIIANSGALNLNAVAKTNVSFWIDWELTLRAVGGSANFMHMGMFTSESVVGSPANSAGGSGSLLLPVSAPAVGANFDAKASQQLDLTATWSIANAGNSIQTHMYKVVSDN
jgi:hypothetical protein